MRRLVIALVLIGSILGALAIVEWRGVAVSAAQAVTPTPPYPVAPIIPGAGNGVQIWMAGPFCVDTWWGAGRQCAEHKGDELHVGAGWKLDLPGPAWIAPQGRRADGAWLLWAVAKSNDQPPGASFVAVIGPSLFTVPDLVTASPSPTATVTPPPTNGATATPGVTPTAAPSPQGGTPTPTRTLPGPIPGPFSGQLSVNGMCSLGGEIAYLYNIRRDASNKIISFDKLICTTRAELRAIQNFDAIATLDARVPITTAWWLLSTPTPEGLGR